MEAQPPQPAVNQAVLDALSQIEQQLQTGLVTPSSRGGGAEMSEVLQAMQVRSLCCRSGSCLLHATCWLHRHLQNLVE